MLGVTLEEMEPMLPRTKEQALTVALTITTISRETTIRTVARPHPEIRIPTWTGITTMTWVAHRAGSGILIRSIRAVARYQAQGIEGLNI